MDLDGDGGDDEGAPEDRGGGPDEMDVDPPAADHIDDATEDKLEDAEGMDEDEQETEAGEGEEEEKLEPESLAEQEDQGEEGADAENEGNNIQDSAHCLDEDKQAEENPDGEEQDKDASQAIDDQAKMSTQPFGVQGATGQKSAADLQEDASAEDMPDEGEEGAAQNSSLGRENKKQREMKNDTSKEKAGKKDEKADPNPRRSVGDALKKWMSRLKDISDAPEEEKEGETNEDKAERTDEPVGEDSMDFEFVQDDEQAADTQAMADATADQMGEMDPKALADDKEEKEYGNDMEPAESEKDDDSDAEDASKETEDGEQKSKQKSNKLSGALEVGRNEPEDEAAKQQEGRDQGDKNGNDSDASDGASEGDDTGVDFNRHHPLDRDDDSEDGAGQDNDSPLDSQDYEELRRELEQSVTEWRESGQDAEEAHELWRNYTSLTRDLSFALCEQLRLILEPTLATKLKGDYRTGKRLNMRKIIPYIASQFKKDKIWLRRTKPSKRTYQIMIAIDDSRSMAESRSVQLAYESLAVITKALTQLEAGDVSVMSFGQDVRLLHPFDRPFSDEAGADVIRRFTFAQDRTNVRQMMDTAMGVLEHARLEGAGGGGPGATDLWQLQLVLSDGICEDHEMVRSLVRRAAEQRIMVVFIVLDNRGDKDSITKMTNVTYGSDPVTGKPLLQMNKYMDTFPFDYYVICKDIGALPEVLADTLRQYFMFVS
ncbi:hypothetical protein HKX48_003155 [Thoreauomyces humboldtii]|nr:hypothetical protein HKX48_003155 [Thoreauomyces humboldtii]